MESDIQHEQKSSKWRLLFISYESLFQNFENIAFCSKGRRRDALKAPPPLLSHIAFSCKKTSELIVRRCSASQFLADEPKSVDLQDISFVSPIRPQSSGRHTVDFGSQRSSLRGLGNELWG